MGFLVLFSWAISPSSGVHCAAAVGRRVGHHIATYTTKFSLPHCQRLPSIKLCLSRAIRLIGDYFQNFPKIRLAPSVIDGCIGGKIVSRPIGGGCSHRRLTSLVCVMLSGGILSLRGVSALFRVRETRYATTRTCSCFYSRIRGYLPCVFKTDDAVYNLSPSTSSRGHLLHNAVITTIGGVCLSYYFITVQRRRTL